MNITIEFHGTSPLLMHNPRMVDPEFDLNRQIKAITAKRKKTDDDHNAIERLEWYGGLYSSPNGGSGVMITQPTAPTVRNDEERASHSGAGPTVIAALFVLPDGPYADVLGVDCWGQDRDARRYSGPYKVIAHPPCERWGRYWFGGPSARVRRVKGDDDGCFASALMSVRRWGGVLEHPAASAAWKAYGLIEPPRAGGWVVADWFGGWTCCVDQGHYGHLAQKATWLYAVGVRLPILTWGKSSRRVRLDDGFHSREERRRKIQLGTCQRLSKRQRTETPIPFRDLLLAMTKP